MNSHVVITNNPIRYICLRLIPKSNSIPRCLREEGEVRCGDLIAKSEIATP